jgi:hypothetical protein
LSSEVDTLNQKKSFLSSLKSKLDEMVRIETEREAKEKKDLLERLINGVHEKLKEEKIQERILKNSIGNLEKMETKILV